MTEPTTWTRRRVLTATGTVTAAALAGCNTGATGADPTDSPTATEHEDEHDDEHDDDHGTDTHEEEAQHEHGGHLPEEPSAAASVEMVSTDAGNHHFAPHVAWIEPGGTVTWTLESGVHTATAYAAGNDLPARVPEGTEAWDSGSLSEEGATYERTFEEPGVYDYVCTPHRSVGMIGTVVVGEPDPHEQQGLTEPGDSLGEKERHKIEELNGSVKELLGDSH